MPAEVAAQIAEHVQSGCPEEVCELIAGHQLPLAPRCPETSSLTDIAHAFYPDAVYLIVNLVTPDQPVVRGFRIAGGRVREITVKSEVEGDASRSLSKCV